jgi:hypothetical protein
MHEDEHALGKTYAIRTLTRLQDLNFNSRPMPFPNLGLSLIVHACTLALKKTHAID